MHKYQHSFLFEDTSKVKAIEQKDNFLFAELEETIFYPGGGGQPCDKGIIKNDSFEGEVLEVIKEKEKIIHKIMPTLGSLKEGDTVQLFINKPRRERLIKMHTGEHILFKSLEYVLGEISLIKIDLDEIESSLFISANDVTWDKIFQAEEMANKIIGEDRQIIKKEYPKTDAVMMQKLRIKPDRIISETVRVLEIKDFDWSACTGTHADSTGYVVNLLITKFSQAKGGYEIRFKTNAKKDLFELAGLARKAMSSLQTDDASMISSIERLQKENETYKERFRVISAKLLNNYKHEPLKGRVNFIYNMVEDVEKKQLVDKCNELMKEKTIICFISESGGKFTVLLSISKDISLNAHQMLSKALALVNGKGGGKENFAMGSFEGHAPGFFLDELKKIIIERQNILGFSFKE